MGNVPPIKISSAVSLCTPARVRCGELRLRVTTDVTGLTQTHAATNLVPRSKMSPRGVMATPCCASQGAALDEIFEGKASKGWPRVQVQLPRNHIPEAHLEPVPTPANHLIAVRDALSMGQG